MMSMKIRKNHGVDFHCIITRISRNEATNLVKKVELSNIKLCKEILMFGDTKIEKHKFYHRKNAIF